MTGGAKGARAQSMRVARADAAALRGALPAMVVARGRGFEPTPIERLSARSALHRIQDALAGADDAPGELAAEYAALAAEYAELPTAGLDLLADAAPPTPGAIAAEGLSDASAPLPYLARIQAAFGRHDVSGIRTTTGGRAGAASSALGARAFAYGDKVGFAHEPDLHTAAHEAAHVVQQRAGVSLAGGAGAEGDAYEEHADRVADAVAAGHSAEALLDAMPAGGGAGQHAGVQRKSGSKDPRADWVTAPAYAHLYRDQILVEVDQYLKQARFPHPHARLQWRPGSQPGGWMAHKLRDHVHADTWTDAFQLHQLLPGVHVGKLIDVARLLPEHPPEAYDKPDPGPPPDTVSNLVRQSMELANAAARPLDFTRRATAHRQGIDDGPRGPKVWYPEVGVALAGALYAQLLESIQRMGARLLALQEATEKEKQKTADGTPVLYTYPLDVLVFEVLNTPNMMQHLAGDGRKDNVEGRRALGAQKPVKKFVWLGEKDPRLVHWILVEDPADATVEDVLTRLSGGDTENVFAHARHEAHTKSSPPYFWTPFIPPNAKMPAKGQEVEDANDLGNTGLADAVARAQRPPAPGGGTADPTKPDPQAERALARLDIQLHWLDKSLRPWGAAGKLLAGAIAFVARRIEDKKKPKDLAGWSAHLIAQERAVASIASQVSGLLGELAGSNVTPADRQVLPAVMPMIEVLVAYARAAGVSHLPRSLAPALRDAEQRHRLMPLALAEMKLQEARQSLADQEATRDQVEERMDRAVDAKSNLARMPDLAKRMAVMRARVLRGEKLNAGELDSVSAGADGVAMRGRLLRILMMLDDVDKRSDKIDDVIRNNNLKIRTLVKDQFDRLKRIEFSSPDVQRGVIADVGKELGKLDNVLSDDGKSGGGFNAHIKYVNERIADAELRSLILNMVLEIGVMLITGQIVGAGMAVLRGLAMARRIAVAAELIGEARSARAVFAVGEMVFQATAQTAVTGAMRGTGFKPGEFAENLLGNAITAVAMKPFAKLFGNAKELEAEIKSFRQLAVKSGKFLGKGAIDVGVGVASNKVAHGIIAGDLTGPDGQELSAQALSFLAGRVVAKRAEEMNRRIEEAMKIYGQWHFAELKQRSHALLRETAAVGKSPAPDVIARLMEKQNSLLLGERAAYKGLQQDGEKVDTKANDAAIAQMGVDQVDLPLRLVKLEPVVGAEVFRGTGDQIRDALAIAQKSGIPLTGAPDGNGVWTLKAGDRTITVHETATAPGGYRKMSHEPDAKAPKELDGRARVSVGNLDALAKELRVPRVVVGTHLDNAVEIHYERVRTPLGTDVRVTHVTVGRNALVSDVQRHAHTVKRVSHYNGVIGRLRKLWDKFFGGSKPLGNPFLEGSRAWEAVEEIRKLDVLIDDRANWDPKTVDLAIVEAEIRFLDGRRRFYEDVIRSAEDTGVLAGSGKISKDDARKDTAVLTKHAIANGWPFPQRKNGEPDFDNYYYRKKDVPKGDFELVLMPNSKKPPLRVEVQGKKRVLVEGGGYEVVRISTKTSTADVVEKLWQDPSIAKFAAMLKDAGIVKGDVEAKVRAAAEDVYKKAKQHAKNGTLRWDTLRGNVKDRFRADVRARLAKAEHAEMLRMLKDLDEGDRGNLAEDWYVAHHVREADPDRHVAYTVGGGKNSQDRAADVFTNQQVIEIKFIKGKIDLAQYEAYKALVKSGDGIGTGDKAVKKIKYVFIDPEGALANLDHFAKELKSADVREIVEIEVFIDGKPKVVRSASGVLGLRDDLVREVAKKTAKP
jgi:hypothetical protein